MLMFRLRLYLCLAGAAVMAERLASEMEPVWWNVAAFTIFLVLPFTETCPACRRQFVNHRRWGVFSLAILPWYPSLRCPDADVPPS